MGDRQSTRNASSALPQDRLFIVGPMAAGKSAVGRRLAARLQMPFFDTDDEIEQRTGVDIDYIFEREGEAGFRRRECAVIAELTAKQPVILSTGGGAVLADENRTLLSKRGLVVYLATSVRTQLARTRHSNHRPLLQTEDRGRTLEALATVRNALYESVADLTLPTDGCTVDAVVGQLITRLKQREGLDTSTPPDAQEPSP
ncbi:MAG: shikimate kinase AroK [Pseudomonadota bacterium]